MRLPRGKKISPMTWGSCDRSIVLIPETLISQIKDQIRTKMPPVVQPKRKQAGSPLAGGRRAQSANPRPPKQHQYWIKWQTKQQWTNNKPSRGRTDQFITQVKDDCLNKNKQEQEQAKTWKIQLRPWKRSIFTVNIWKRRWPRMKRKSAQKATDKNIQRTTKNTKSKNHKEYCKWIICNRRETALSGICNSQREHILEDNTQRER